VIERLSVFFSGNQPPAKAKSGLPVSPDAPAHKKEETGETDAETAGSSPAQAGPIPQAKCDLAPTPGALIPPADFVPHATELAVATTPFGSAERTGDVPINPPASPEPEPSGVAAANFQRGKSTAGMTPATAALPRLLSQTDGGPTGPSTPAKRSMDLPQVLPPPGNATSELPVVEMADGIADIQRPPATITITTAPRPERAPILDSTRPADGTAIAQQDATMKMATKKTNFSEAKQKLPTSTSGSGAVAPAAGENLPLAAKRGENGPARPQRNVAPATVKIRVEPDLPSGDGISTNVGAARIILPAAVNLIHFPSPVPQYVERTREMVSLQVIRLQEVGMDEMHVVIKPDIGLQLSLHLQQRGGGVEVQAVLDRGNFGLLNRHWPELQQQLELRGVRVAPLANAEQSFGGGSEGFRQPTTSHGQQAGDDAEPAEMPAALLPGLPTATATASASTISSRRLETWA
jgi:hypothetical protein